MRGGRRREEADEKEKKMKEKKMRRNIGMPTEHLLLLLCWLCMASSNSFLCQLLPHPTAMAVWN
jgi:hypothetical protein